MNFKPTQRQPRYDIAHDARILRVSARRLGMTLIGHCDDPKLFHRWLRLNRNRKTLPTTQVVSSRGAAVRWGGLRAPGFKISVRVVPSREVGCLLLHPVVEEKGVPRRRSRRGTLFKPTNRIFK
jgi:hypothetical protein